MGNGVLKIWEKQINSSSRTKRGPYYMDERGYFSIFNESER
jgi:hypothetical protein